MRTRSTPGVRGAVAILACSLLAAACGIEADPSPRALPVSTTTTTVPTTEPTGEAETVLYMVKASALVPIVRRLPARTPREVMSSLLVPPSGGEGQGLSSSIPSATRLLGISGPENGLVEIDLSEDFEDVEGEARVLAVGQIVMSETLLPDVETLTFSIEGEPLSVFSPESGDVEVVDACDYATTLTDPTAEDVDLTIQQALSLNDRRQELRESC